MTVSEERLTELNASLRSIRSVSIPGDENRKWSALIYILVHHPKCKGLNEVVNFATKQIDKSKIEIRLRKERWNFEERILLGLALHLYDLQLDFDFSQLMALELVKRQIAFNAIEIRLGLCNFEDVLLGDLAS
ncbi:hypothetical protein [Paenibacillus macerans]|uniref:Uncharacterized protein n=1 Tax=Paenibacillus macerans TaxID=44252 RepID=A0A090Y353_PAEMA|nr:hypothetical protein [Paenibacillus macerans]KFM93158.1 hypothetical protein DJ90_2975 [Paenibacillus macerans]MCY7561579.1 hypothetical protein [Paenibacillus macerans]MEC0153322.1 hypothetical protein [Paenibacillus macerans]SUA84823.1 Uncharacterised protein [Paenibacillus macerans]